MNLFEIILSKAKEFRSRIYSFECKWLLFGMFEKIGNVLRYDI